MAAPFNRRAKIAKQKASVLSAKGKAMKILLAVDDSKFSEAAVKSLADRVVKEFRLRGMRLHEDDNMNCFNRHLLATVVIFFLLGALGFTQNSISPSEAKSHVGERATVCGLVVGTHYAAQSRGNPTFINLDKPYPNQIFTVLIWGSERPKCGDPAGMCQMKHICATGKISDYKRARNNRLRALSNQDSVAKPARRTRLKQEISARFKPLPS